MIKVLEEIIEKVRALPEERQRHLARVLEELVDDDAGTPVRTLSDREKALLEQSRQDFAAGRTYSLDEVIEYTNAQLAPLGVPPYKKS